MWYVVVIDDKPVKYFSYLKCAFNLAQKEALKNKNDSFIYDKNGNCIGNVISKKTGCFVYGKVM